MIQHTCRVAHLGTCVPWSTFYEVLLLLKLHGGRHATQRIFKFPKFRLKCLKACIPGNFWIGRFWLVNSLPQIPGASWYTCFLSVLAFASALTWGADYGSEDQKHSPLILVVGLILLWRIFLQLWQCAWFKDPSKLKMRFPELTPWNRQHHRSWQCAWLFLCGPRRTTAFTKTSGGCTCPNFKYAHGAEMACRLTDNCLVRVKSNWVFIPPP